MRKRWRYLAGTCLALGCLAGSLTGCQKRAVRPGDVPGFDQGETYLSIWVHSIEETEEGQVYRKAVDRFNEQYNGRYFADSSSPGMTAAEAIPTRSMHRSWPEACRTY